MAELGQILEEFDDKSHALEAYRQAKTLDPFIDGIEDRIRQLTRGVEGQGFDRTVNAVTQAPGSPLTFAFVAFSLAATPALAEPSFVGIWYSAYQPDDRA